MRIFIQKLGKSLMGPLSIIVAAGLLTADGVVAVTEQINETRLFHAAVHYLLHIEFLH